MIKIYRDPDPKDQAGGQPVNPAVVEVKVEAPKGKEGWAELAKTDPVKFAELTQARMDTIFRQNQETKEKLAQQEEHNRNLQAEIERFKAPFKPQVEQEQTDRYGAGRYPQSEDEWNDLMIERPVFGADLRHHYLNSQKNLQSDFNRARSEAVNVLTTEHADMYHTVIDQDTGKPKLDDKGHVMVVVDPNTGGPAFNGASEKGKLWSQIYDEAWATGADGTRTNPYNSMKNAPLVMMAEMERRLRQKGANMVRDQNNVAETDQSGVAPKGVAAPKNVTLKFNSEEEKQHAQRAVARGTYRSLEEYVTNRDQKEVGYAEPNRRPDFTKK